MSSKAGKILGLFAILTIGFILFLVRVFDITTSDRFQVNLIKKETDTPLRGEISSADGYKIANSKQTYSVAVNPENIKSDQYDLFIKLFTIYSGLNEKELKAMLKGDKRVVLLNSADAKTARNFRQLSTTLDRMKIFTPKKVGGKYYRYGLEVLENEFLRNYPYGDSLEPALGYVQTGGMSGLAGVEGFYEKSISAERPGFTRGYKDVGGNLILNAKLDKIVKSDGLNLKLNIDVKLQKQIEHIVDSFKNSLEADEIIASVLDSSTGRVIGLASSNRYAPSNIPKSSVSAMKINSIQYVYEPGSTLKPFVFALLLESGKVNPTEIVKGYNGRMQLGGKIITDEHKALYMSAEDGIIFSSNIVMAQLAQRLGVIEYFDGLSKFGFGKKSNIDMLYELKGNLPEKSSLSREIYKATASYGYGLRVNFMQVMAGYNIFNNEGKYITPKLADSLYSDSYRQKITPDEERQVISSDSAYRIKGILKKVVEKGTGVGAAIEGLDIGGKTGTAHIAKGGGYVRHFNSSFFGFANDMRSKYTIGVLVIEPKKEHFASMTAVPVFKEIVLNMVKSNLLKPNTTSLDNTTKPSIQSIVPTKHIE